MCMKSIPLKTLLHRNKPITLLKTKVNKISIKLKYFTGIIQIYGIPLDGYF